MTDRRPAVVLACKPEVRAAVVREAQLERLQQIADVRFGEFDRPSDYVEAPPPDRRDRPTADRARRRRRRAHRLDRRAADHRRDHGRLPEPAVHRRARGRPVRAAGSTSRPPGSAASGRSTRRTARHTASRSGRSALMLVGLRNAGEQFRDIMDRKPPFHAVALDERAFKPDELTGKTVGLDRLRDHRSTAARAARAVPHDHLRVRPVRAARARRRLRHHVHVARQRALAVGRRRLPRADHAGDPGHARCPRVRSACATGRSSSTCHAARSSRPTR